MPATRAILHTLPSFSNNIRSGFPALICYIILLTCLIFFKVKETVIASPVDNVTITSKGVNYLGSGTFNPSLLRIICS